MRDARVAIVGAGPGDPMLLTRRGADLLAGADLVVLDRHSLDAIAALAPATAERRFVGRTPESPAWDTDRIADLVADAAGAGKAVVRLKSGDPFIASRGGEEVIALRARGIEAEVVPGVSAATAAPLAARWPTSELVTILAANRDPVYPALDVAPLADPRATLVVLTGRSTQGELAAALVDHGRDPSTPAAAVHAVTRPGERIERTDLARLGSTRLPAPATVLVAAGTSRAHP